MSLPRSSSAVLRRFAFAACVFALTASPLTGQTPAPNPAAARAEAFISARQYAAAVTIYDSLTRAQPTQPRFWVRYGMSLQLAGKPDQAIVAYRRAIGITTTPVAMYNLATLFALRGQKDSALHWLDQASQNGVSNDQSTAADTSFASIRSDARFTAILERMRTAMRPCLTRKESRMFDFWVGEWEVRNVGGQLAGTSSVQLLLEGCAILENWTDGQNGQGKSMNSFNTDLGMWQQFWTDQYGRVTEYRHSEWVDGSLRFTARQRMPRGPAVIHMTFTPLPDGRVRQWGETSFDDGKTWAPSFDLYYNRKK
jgi:hypothetical protein